MGAGDTVSVGPVPAWGAPTGGAPVSPAILLEVQAFLIDEACRLDEGRFGEWVDLFNEDGVYWVPSEPGQASPDDMLSIFYESKALLRLRAQRLAHPQTHAQVPRSRTHHHINNVSVADLGAGRYMAYSLLLVVEWRAGEQTLFSARCRHELQRGGEGLRIAGKRVDLLNCDAPHRAISVPF